MGIDCDFLVNLSVQCLVPKRRRRRSSRESQSSGKVSTTSTIVSTNSNRYAIVILLLLSFILHCVFRPDPRSNLTTRLSLKWKNNVFALYAPDILNSPPKSVNLLFSRVIPIILSPPAPHIIKGKKISPRSCRKQNRGTQAHCLPEAEPRGRRILEHSRRICPYLQVHWR